MKINFDAPILDPKDNPMMEKTIVPAAEDGGKLRVLTGDRRQRVADNPFADDRASAVGGDKRRALDVAFLGPNPYLGSVLLEPSDTRARAQLDELGKRFAAVEQ